jgi:hypothetical protein
MNPTVSIDQPCFAGLIGSVSVIGEIVGSV